MKYLKPYLVAVVGVMLCMVLVSLSNVAVIPLVSKLSGSIGQKQLQGINITIFLALLVYFAKGIFTYGQVYLSAFVGQGVMKDLRIDLYRHVQTLPVGFFNKNRIGDIAFRILFDVGSVQSAMLSSATDIIPNILTLICVMGYLSYLNWKLTLFSLILFPLLSYTITKIGKDMRNISMRIQRKNADIASMIHEKLAGIRIVKSFTMESREVKMFTDESETSFWISMREAAINATSTPILAMIQASVVLAIVWFGAYEVIAGNLSPNDLIAFFTGVALLADPISKLSRMNLTIQKALASAERVFEIADIASEVKVRPDAKKIEKIKGAVEFKDLSFQYDINEAHALNNINVKVNAGEIIALVGPSGAGKTTFVNMIPRFYDPTQGALFIDGIDLRDCDLYSLRRHIGIVPQETVLFSDTIGGNIAYGKLDATEAEIIAAAKMANAHDFILSMPQGYNTYVGERGTRLSGGQRQRIAIARALLRDPRILILDEATSSLDTESERLVQDALEKLMKGRTTFVIAHRLSTVQIADRILVFKDARIIEEGTHRELLDKGGLYKRLYEMQFRDDRKPKEVVS